MENDFTLFGKPLSYLYQRSPDIHIGERRIELPIANEWVTKNCFDIENPQGFIEIGAVLPSWIGWMECDHDVIDPYDSYPFAIREDAENYDYTGKNVLSISTIEHIGMPDYGNTEISEEKAINVLRKIISDAAHFFVSIPIGYNKPLDEYIQTSSTCAGLPLIVFKQTTERNTWEEVEEPDFNAEYNSPFLFANQVLFLTDDIKWAL